MTELKDSKPNPGSDDAVDRGCLCPVMANCRGRGVFGREGEFWMSSDCPVHTEDRKEPGC